MCVCVCACIAMGPRLTNCSIHHPDLMGDLRAHGIGLRLLLVCQGGKYVLQLMLSTNQRLQYPNGC